MASPRQLAYKDRFVWLLEQVVSSIFDDCDDFSDRFVFPDMDTRVPLVIQLSQREWTTLYSAVLTGADLSYPNTSHDVEYLFLQTVICPMNQFCAAMIDCLQNDPDVWAALQQLLSDEGYTGGVGNPDEPLSASQLGENLLPTGYICTDDATFGMAVAVVDSINEATTEVLQAIELLTNPLEIASELADNIPGAAALISGVEVANWIQDSATEAYELAWSTTIRDELACILWCEMKQDCSLTLEMIFDIYLEEAGVAPPSGNTLEEWLIWLIAIPFVVDLATVATVSLMGLLAMKYGGKFGEFALGIRSLETVIALNVDATNSNWSILCDACPTTWCYEWFTGSDEDASAIELSGCTATFTVNLVTGCAGNAPGAQFFGIRIDFPVPTHITTIEFEVDMHATRASSSDKCQFSIESTIVYNVDTPEGVSLHEHSGDWDAVDFVYIQCWAANNAIGPSPASDGGFAYLNYLKLTGPAPNPMGEDNC